MIIYEFSLYSTISIWNIKSIPHMVEALHMKKVKKISSYKSEKSRLSLQKESIRIGYWLIVIRKKYKRETP